MRIPERKVSFSVSVIDKLLTEITKVWSGYQDKIKRETFWSSNWKCCFVPVKKIVEVAGSFVCWFVLVLVFVFNRMAAHSSSFCSQLGYF